METQNIISYIRKEVEGGKTKQHIQEQLSAVGWSDEDVQVAYTKTLLEMGVPSPIGAQKGTLQKKMSVVEVVINLFSFLLLGVIATALGTLYFNIIGYFFPDALERYSYYGYNEMITTTHYAMAALIIGFPFYVGAVLMWFRAFNNDETKVESELTKWITYLLLLIASAVIVGDLIAVVYTFLQGEITVRFFLKGLTILFIAGGIFGFYVLERKKIQYKRTIPMGMFRALCISTCLVIVVGVVFGFVTTGSPETERKRSLDDQRSQDLYDLAICINDYAKQFKKLPTTVAELETTSMFSYCAQKTDPETGKPYDYVLQKQVTQKLPVGEGGFSLCATFSSDSSASGQYQYEYMDIYQTKWYNHSAGYTCFEEVVAVEPVVKEGVFIPETAE